jgi:hypothetical protein
MCFLSGFFNNQKKAKNIMELDSLNVTSPENSTALVEESLETAGLQGKVSAALFLAVRILRVLHNKHFLQHQKNCKLSTRLKGTKKAVEPTDDLKGQQ